MTERFRRVNENAILYRFIAEDSSTWNGRGPVNTSDMSNPSFSNSPWMRGALHSGFASL